REGRVCRPIVRSRYNWGTTAWRPNCRRAGPVLGGLWPRQIAIDADGHAVLASADPTFKQYHATAAHLYRRTQYGVEHNPGARLQCYNVRQPHGLFIKHHIELEL